MVNGLIQTRVGQILLAVSWIWLLGMVTWGVWSGMVNFTVILQVVTPVLSALFGGAGVHYITTVVQNRKNENGTRVH